MPSRSLLCVAAFLVLWPALAGCPSNSASSPPSERPAKSVRAKRSQSPAKGSKSAARPSGKKAAIPALPEQDPIFEGWSTPEVAIVISGEQNGFIEPCGCAGLENQKGGLSRRHTFLKQLEKDGWQTLPLDLGGQVSRFGTQAELKFQTSVDALHTMDYQAVAFGPDDLRLPAVELFSAMAKEGSSFVSANVSISFDEQALPRSRVVERAGIKLGITAIVGEQYQQKVNNDELVFTPPADALAAVLVDLEGKCDLLILLSHATREESLALARAFPKLDVIITAGGADEPPREPERVDGTNAWLVEIGHKGMYVGVIGIFNDDREPLRYQRVPLDKRFKDSEEMLAAMRQYQAHLRAAGFEGLGLRPAAHPSGRSFVGSHKCGECHTKAHAIWEKTPHAHATATLVDLETPRHFDPECLSCHATGWEPQRFTPFESGYLGLEETPLLTGNGCENCHGPGSAHVAAEEAGKDDAEMAALRNDMRLPLASAEQACSQCHDLDNSPGFIEKGFDHYWPKVEHKGKD